MGDGGWAGGEVACRHHVAFDGHHKATHGFHKIKGQLIMQMTVTRYAASHPGIIPRVELAMGTGTHEIVPGTTSRYPVLPKIPGTYLAQHCLTPEAKARAVRNK